MVLCATPIRRATYPSGRRARAPSGGGAPQDGSVGKAPRRRRWLNLGPYVDNNRHMEIMKGRDGNADGSLIDGGGQRPDDAAISYGAVHAAIDDVSEFVTKRI